MKVSFGVVRILLIVSVTKAATLYDELSALNATQFLSVVNKAGLQQQLQGQGPFTLLVPTDSAFAKIPANDLAAVLADSTKLMDVAQYHIVSGIHYTKEFFFGRHHFLNSTNNHVIRAYRSASGMHFNQATAVKTNINATNGVIHLINTVLDVPEGTVIDILGKPEYNVSKFLQIVKDAHLDRNYGNPTGLNRYTVFAPNNAAVDALPSTTLTMLSKDYTYLRMLVEYHVHSGTMHARTLMKRHSVSTTLPAHDVNVTVTSSGDIMLNNRAVVTMPDIEGENGVVHVIDHVLIPQILLPIVG